MRFGRLMARSNSISLHTKRGFIVTTHDGSLFISFHGRYFTSEVLRQGIKVKGSQPPIENSVRLIKRRGPTYYIAVPCTKTFPVTTAKPVASYDPGGRNFCTVVDTAGRTVSITDPHGYLRTAL
jgi:phosphotransferase system IIA component